MPPTSEVFVNKVSRTDRKVLVHYLDGGGNRREKQMPFTEFQAFCVAWYAEEIRSRRAENRKSTLVSSARVG